MVDSINPNIKYNAMGEIISKGVDGVVKKQEKGAIAKQQGQTEDALQEVVFQDTTETDEQQSTKNNKKYGNESEETVDSALIKQMQAEIDKLKEELKAAKKTRGISGSVTAFFGGGTTKLQKEIKKKEAYLADAIKSPDKIESAYEKIMGKKLTDEIKNQTEQELALNSQLTSDDKKIMKEALLAEIESISGAMDDIKNDQGWFSKGLGKVNNLLGFGTSEKESKAQIEALKKQIEALDTDSDDFMAQYKALTGYDLLESINALNEGNMQLDNSKAVESIYDYQHTQTTLKEVGSGIVTGTVAAAAVVAAPFTGGASIALGAAVGGATKVAIEGTDTIGTSKKYSFEQALLDFGSGAIEGATTGMMLGRAGLAGKGLGIFKGAGKTAVTKGGKVGLTKAFEGLGKSALNGAKIAGFSTTSSYLLNTTGKTALYDLTENYTVSDMPSNIVQNDDGTYSLYYKVTDSKTGDELYYNVEKLDSVSQDENGNLIKGNILEKSQTNDFSFKDFGKQLAISTVSAVAGASIGKFTGGFINPNIMGATGSAALGNAAEIGADAILSLGADYAIADVQSVIEKGEHIEAKDFFSWDRMINEGRNQLRGLFIGLAASKANSKAAIDSTMAEGLTDGVKINDSSALPVKTTDSVETVKINNSGDESVPLILKLQTETGGGAPFAGMALSKNLDLSNLELSAEHAAKAAQLVFDGDIEAARKYVVDYRLDGTSNDIDNFIKDAQVKMQEMGINADNQKAFALMAELKPDFNKLSDDAILKAGQLVLDGDIEAARMCLKDDMSDSEINSFIGRAQSKIKETGLDVDLEKTNTLAGKTLLEDIKNNYNGFAHMSEHTIMKMAQMVLDGDIEGARKYLEECDIDGMKDVDDIDDFIKLTEESIQKLGFDKKISDTSTIDAKNVYQKIQTSLNSNSESDVNDMISTIMKSGATKEEAVLVLQKLTQFGGAESMQTAFKESGLSETINGFEDIKKISANTALSYLCKNKEQITLLDPDNGGKKGFVLDDSGLKYLEDLKQNDPAAFSALMSRDDLQFINFEGLDKGISIYSQGGNNESTLQAASDIITEAKQIQQNQGTTFEEAVKTAINKSTFDRAENLGIDISNIKTVSGVDKTADVKTITENLAPLNTSDTKIRKTAQAIAETLFKDPAAAIKAKELIIKYLDAEVDIYSPKRLGEELVKINSNIEQKVSSMTKANGENFTKDDIYYLIPQAGKSYEQILYQYAKVNNIPDDRFIYANAQELMNLPDSKIYVVVDDVIGSGDSMISQGDGLQYRTSGHFGDRHIIMAPVVSGSSGADKIEGVIQTKGRTGQDFLLIDESQIKTPLKETEFYQNLSEYEKTMLEQIMDAVSINAPWGSKGHGFASYAILFPYMAPDNDSALSSFFFEELLLNPSAIKNKYDETLSSNQEVLKRAESMD